MAFKLFKALSDPVRRDVLMMLRNEKMSAGDIASRFDLTQATVSYHLNQLKSADLVHETRSKNFIYYEINTTVLDELILWLKQLKNEECTQNEEKRIYIGELKNEY